MTASPCRGELVLLTAVTTSPTAFVADNLTLTAPGAYGNTATSYTGTKNVTFSGANVIGTYDPAVTDEGSAVNFGTATALTFSNGMANVSGSSNGATKLYKVETANIVATAGHWPTDRRVRMAPSW